MSNATTSVPRKLMIGVVLAFIAGLFPFLVSSYQYAMFLVSKANPSEPWRASGFAPVCFSLDDLGQSCEHIPACAGGRPQDAADADWQTCEVADQFVLAQHIEFANVINSGLMILIISVFGLRRREKWAWWTLLFIFLWVGLNDAIALIDDHQRPVPLIAEVFGLGGLALAWPFVFKKS